MTPDASQRPTPATLNRNWNELLQELRVTQTGVQILTGFLLTVPFQARFEDLTQDQKILYAVVLAGSIVTTALVVAPVAIHRALFRQRRRLLIVESGAVLARAGLAMLALTVTGVLFLCIDLTLGRTAGYVGLALTAVLLGGLWFVSPYWLDSRGSLPANELDESEVRSSAREQAAFEANGECDEPEEDEEPERNHEDKDDQSWSRTDR